MPLPSLGKTKKAKNLKVKPKTLDFSFQKQQVIENVKQKTLSVLITSTK